MFSKIKITSLIILFAASACIHNNTKPTINEGLILDLNADKDVAIVEDHLVVAWQNQVTKAPANLFEYTDEGRTEIGSGRPLLNENDQSIRNHNTIIFREDELVNDNDNAFDKLITGQGYTWLAVIKPYEQHRGEGNYPQAFFGCLRNSAPPQDEGGQFAGFYGSFYIDGRIWMTSRNGEGNFSRNGYNTPEIAGPYLPINKWYIVAGRQAKGEPGTMVNLDLFVNSSITPVNSGKYPVSTWEPSRMAIGTERNAINHQGGESFDGELARLLIYNRPLSAAEMKSSFNELKSLYGLEHIPEVINSELLN